MGEEAAPPPLVISIKNMVFVLQNMLPTKYFSISINMLQDVIKIHIFLLRIQAPRGAKLGGGGGWLAPTWLRRC